MVKKKSRPRTPRDEILRGIIEYVKHCENGDKTKEQWAAMTGHSLSDLRRWTTPSRPYLVNARAVIADEMTFEQAVSRKPRKDIGTGAKANKGGNGLKGKKRGKYKTKAKPFKDQPYEEILNRHSDARDSLAVLGEKRVVDNAATLSENVALLDPEDPDYDVHVLRHENRTLNLELSELKENFRELVGKLNELEDRKGKLHRYLGMMTESEIDRTGR